MRYVKCIQSTGAQYIDTGIVPNANTIVEMKYSVQSIKNLGPHMLSNDAWFFPFPREYGGSPHFFAKRMGAESKIDLIPEVNKDYVIRVYPNNQVIINDVTYVTIETGTTTSNKNLYMFTYCNAPSNQLYTANAMVYYCKIWDGETLIRDFKPVLDDNGVAGLYDEVNQKFYGNNGEGIFTYLPIEPSKCLINESTLIGLANEIRNKFGYMDKIHTSEMTDILSNISTDDQLIQRTVSGNYYNSRITQVGEYGFAMATNLTSVNLPRCSKLSQYAFYYDTGLTSVSLPNLTSMRRWAFAYCSSLNSIELSMCTEISSNAFINCINLKSVSFPVCKTILSSAFKNCSSLQSINVPKCTKIDNNAFYGCTNLTSVSFPACTDIGSSAFYSCTNLAYIDFPAFSGTVTSTLLGMSFGSFKKLLAVSFSKSPNIAVSAFNKCSKLASVNFPACTTIGEYAFYNCYSLKNVTLQASTIVELGGSLAFYGSGDGYIYVPASLVSAYKSASYWSYYADRITAIVE